MSATTRHLGTEPAILDLTNMVVTAGALDSELFRPFGPTRDDIPLPYRTFRATRNRPVSGPESGRRRSFHQKAAERPPDERRPLVPDPGPVLLCRLGQC